MTIAVLLAMSSMPVRAQQPGPGYPGGGGHSGIRAGGERPHGHVVLVKDSTIVFRADKGETIAVDASEVNARLRAFLMPGDGVTLALTPSGERDSQTPVVATELQLDSRDKGRREPFARVDGTIEEAAGSHVVFRTREGFTLPLDIGAIRGLPPLAPSEPATLFYEQGRTRESGVIAVWIEPRDVHPSASIDTTPPVETPNTLPPVGTPSTPPPVGTPPADTPSGAGQADPAPPGVSSPAGSRQEIDIRRVR
jgi:hypothetical protein